MLLPVIQLQLLCFIGLSSTFHHPRPRDGYNTFTDTSTILPFNLYPRWGEPYFDISVPNNVTALVGKSAYLSCRVRNLGNKTVSWIRHRDIHILTVGTYTYTTDQRFQTAFHRETNEWTMHIKWAQKRDAGTYECQISTQPIKSYSVRLNVVDPNIEPVDEDILSRAYSDQQNDFAADNDSIIQSDIIKPAAVILGGPDLYVDKGSTINITCTIRFGPEPPGYIFWYHDKKEITFDQTSREIAVRRHNDADWTISYLFIQGADIEDSGNYTCAPSNAGRSSIKVHVFQNGERPEAMQTGTSTYLSNSHCVAHTLLFGIIISICNIFSDYLSSIFYSMYELNLITGKTVNANGGNCRRHSSRSIVEISTTSNKIYATTIKSAAASIIRLHTNYAFLHQR